MKKRLIMFLISLPALVLMSCGLSGSPSSIAKWGTAELIEINDTGSADTPHVVSDANGNSLAVWRQSDGIRFNIWANRYVPSTGWGTAELIETDNAGTTYCPYVAMDANGNAIAVWEQSDGIRFNIWANCYVPGAGWGTAELIETDNADNADYPRIAMDANGNAIAVWPQSDGIRFNIWANRYVPGAGWGTAELIETDNADNADYPHIAMDANGNAIAVWEQSDGIRFNIWANRYVPGAGWGTAELIETDNEGDAHRPQVALDTNGNALVVWEQFDGSQNNIWANRYISGAGWSTAKLIETDNEGDAFSPHITMGTSGNAIAVWEQSDGIRFNIWANHYVQSSGWSTAGLIETNAAGDAYYPQVVIDTKGNAIAVWEQSDGIRSNIWANHYKSGSGWNAAVFIETNDTGDAFHPQVAINASGNAIAVWYQSDGTRFNIWANRYAVQ
jgi:hypothetical protein